MQYGFGLITNPLKIFIVLVLLKKKNGEKYLDIQWEYNYKVPNKKLRNTISGIHHLVTILGKGEWVAETMDDAKQMAIAFNKGVS